MADLRFLADEWPAISQRLDEALSIDATQRDAWLDSLHETDSVKHKLRQLLRGASGVETDAVLLTLPRLTIGPAISGEAGFAAGATVGPYRLMRELGVGGMGLVWLAERVDGGLKRPVALKLPRLSWSGGLAERMGRERDILATLDHPHIARLYDAGVDEHGRPYLALEYVEGEAIDVYCKHHSLPVNDRLRLLLQVARAVAHAHARLVVHRDLKPVNILVTEAGEVRLLDFGIAKLMEGELTQETQLTQQGGRAMTLDYASPEQIRGEPLGTASDVYSLGVVAYELLAQAKPYQLKRQSAAALEEAITSLDVRLASAAAASPGDRRALKGDLDAILNKALKKDVAERYPTVEALAQDIERHLANLPVSAQPDSLSYRGRKFFRRNMRPMAAASAVAVSLIAALSVALWQAQAARAQARRAVAVQEFMKQVFSASDPEVAQGQDIGARELLRRGAARLETDFKDQPDVRAELEHEIADILSTRGENTEAQAHFEKAIALYERSGLGDTDLAVLARLSLSDVLYNEAQFPAAELLAQQCIEIAKHRFGSSPPWLLRARAGFAVLRSRQGDTTAAVSAIESALAEHRRAGYAPSDDTANALSALGHAHMSTESYAQARDAYTLAIAEWRLVPNTEITGLLIERLNLQNARLSVGDNELVAREMPELVAAFEKYVGPAAPNALAARTIWAKSLVATGRYDEGLQLQREVVAKALAADPSDVLAHGRRRRVLVYLLRAAAHYDEGARLASQELAALEAKSPNPGAQIDDLRGVLGELQRATGNPAAGLRTLSDALARSRTLAGYETTRRHATAMTWLALSKHDLGLAEAGSDMAQALAIYRSHAPNDADTLRCAVLVAWLAALERPADADRAAAFNLAASAYAATQPLRHMAHAELALLGAELHERAGLSAQAQAEHAAAVQAWRTATGRDWKPPLAMLH
ncbi:MAG: serine/threonine-protein kinase [Rhizobacter sp.]